MNNLLCEADVCLSTFRFDVVKQYWAAMARCLTEPYISRNDGRKDFVSEDFPQITHHLIGQVCSLIKHRQQNAFNLKGRIPNSPDLLNRLHQFGNPLQRKIFTLNRDKEALCSYESIDRQDIERWRTVNQDEVEFGQY